MAKFVQHVTAFGTKIAINPYWVESLVEGTDVERRVYTNINFAPKINDSENYIKVQLTLEQTIELLEQGT